jgi:hypothetical protein
MSLCRESAFVLQSNPRLSQYNSLNPEKYSIFATSVGPQDGLTVAKIAEGEFWHFVRYPEAVFADKTRTNAPHMADPLE